MKLVCVNCQTRLRIKRNGILTVDMFQDPPEPYEAFTGDLWECPGCKAQIVAGFGQFPVARHFEVDKMKVCMHTAEHTNTLVRNYERLTGVRK